GVLAFCVMAAFARGVAFGAGRGGQATPLPPVQAMMAGGRTSTRSGWSFRSVLGMSQVAAAVILLCGAGLLLRSLVALGRVDSGSRTSEVLTMTISLPFVRANAPAGMRYVTPESQLQFYEAVEREVRSIAVVR